jgi:His-Xaa-Ser system radical SAM maturase HxsB
LKARHFLFDEQSRVALDLLALKYRTRADALAAFTGLHMFVVTLRCTNSCRYCQVSRRTENEGLFDMSVEHADLALDFTFRSPSPAIKIEFQGGEPLLNFPLVRHIIERATEINRKHGKALEFVVASNLALLTDEVLEYCKKFPLVFSTSLDGPRDLHDAHRLMERGSSHQAVVASIVRIHEVLGPNAVSALMTTTRNSLTRAGDIVDEYIRRGLHSIFLRSARPYGLAVQNEIAAAYTASEWVEFYQDALDRILAANRAGYPMREDYTSILLQKMFSPSGSRFVDLQSPAGLGIAAVSFNYDGNVYASDEGRMLAEMGDTEFQLGTLGRDSFDNMMTSEHLLSIL